ncbi:hypothetical protein KO518_06130 [Aestuariibacter sp. A3R04]|nr:hypothetical protein [Aestuariibacter sp. A3R04]
MAWKCQRVGACCFSCCIVCQGGNTDGDHSYKTSHLTGINLIGAAGEHISDASALYTGVDDAIDFRAHTNKFQRELIARALRQAGGNWSRAARSLTMDRANLVRLAKRLGVSVEKQVKE